MKSTRRPRQLHGTLGIKRDQAAFRVKVNQREWSQLTKTVTVLSWLERWCEYYQRVGQWKKLRQSKGNSMIRILIRKEPPFEIHVVVNPAEALDIAKIEAHGHFHVGDFDGEKQIDEAVSAVATYLELEESHSEV